MAMLAAPGMTRNRFIDRIFLPDPTESGRVGPAGALAGVGRPEVTAIRALQVNQRGLVAQ